MIATHPRSPGIYPLAASLALIVVAQATLLSRIHAFGASPDLLLVSVVCWSLAFGVRDGLILGFGGGLGIDLIAGLPLGTSSLALLSVPWLGGLGRAKVFGANALLPALLAALATPLRGGILLLMLQMRGARVDWIASAVRVIGPEIVLNALLAIIVFPIVRSLAGRLGPAAAEH